jgi:metal-responsive CopG/Arc/MetJ family transcriptional regulator
MKAAISIPDPLFKETEATAKALGLTRSKLIQKALEEYLERRRAEKVTAALNRSLAKHPDEVDPFLQHLVLEGMKRTEWKE